MADGFHLLIYDGTATSTTTAGDLTAATDPVFTQRNSHITLTDDLKLLAVKMAGGGLTRGTIKMPTWNAQTLFNIDPLEQSSVTLSPSRVMNLESLRPTLAQDEEIQFQVSGEVNANDTVTVGAWVGTPGWSRNIPKGMGPLSVFCARVTAAPVLANRAWSALASLTFEQGLRAGIYAIVGSHWTGANVLYHRIQFPRSTMYNGRALRPGDIVNNAVGDLPWYQYGEMASPFGVWGKFHTFELPQIEFWSQTRSDTPTLEGRLFLVKLSETTDPNFLGS